MFEFMLYIYICKIYYMMIVNYNIYLNVKKMKGIELDCFEYNIRINFYKGGCVLK